MYSKSYPLWNPYFVNDLLLFCFSSTCELFFSSFTFVQKIPFRNSCAREWCMFSSWFSCMTSSQLLGCWKSRSVIMIIISSMELRFTLCYNAIYFLVRYTRHYLVVLRRSVVRQTDDNNHPYKVWIGTAFLDWSCCFVVFAVWLQLW